MFLADLHIHSKYSRATSRDCVPEFLDLWARKKGLDLIGTGDFTHPAWREELREKLVPAEEGLYTLKSEYRKQDDTVSEAARPRFLLSGELSSIYKKNGKVRKVHNVILLPSLEAADALSRKLELNFNLHSDGRPILGLDSHDLLEITLETCPDAVFIPAHIWTPHFSLFGAYSGFDTIEECFEDLTPHIHALETGLSSDPPMNWRLSALDGYNMVSNSDAHSPANLAREANLFNTDLSYPAIKHALESHDNDEFYGTLEFFPEEGKYHNDGHRNCHVCLAPEETIALHGKCPVCGRRITVGVLHRVVELSDRAAGYVPEHPKHFESIVPLPEVVASSLGVTAASKKAQARYAEIVRELGPEFYILREAPLADVARAAGPCVAEGIRRLRAGEVDISPGFDGEYGKVTVLKKSEVGLFAGQLSLFGAEDEKAAAPKETAPVMPEEEQKAACEQAEPETQSSVHYGLNAEQWEAASSGQRVTAVLAGPGTGKTRTLICRIAYLVEQLGVAPSDITAVTFTNKAANELRQRLMQHFGEKKLVKAMHIGTFHSICLKLLGEWDKHPAVVDSYDALSLMADALRACNCEISPSKALTAVSRVKNGQSTVEREGLPGVAADAYQAQLDRMRVMDYDDILLRTLEKFSQDDPKCEKLFPRFAHLLVDEFQDINRMQFDLIFQWSAHSQSVFVIGDPDQSIYGFRGSDPRCFDKLHEAFAPVCEIRLKQNYRSTPEILRCALPAIRHAGLQLEANRENGGPVRLLSASSPFEEAVFVAKEIGRLVGGIDMLDAHNAHRKKESSTVRGFSDIAVLYRTNRQAELLEDCLAKEGIPYTVSGRDDWLADRRVRGALAFFRLLSNPNDEASLLTYLKSESVPPACVEKLRHGWATGRQTVPSLVSLLKETLGQDTAAAALLEEYAPLMRSGNPAELVASWAESHGQTAEPCMERLYNTALLHTRMADFLQNLTIGGEADICRNGTKVYTPDAVSLLTLHAAKGLEFPAVFLCGVNDGLIPYHSRTRISDEGEERRLFYVGMTRAQDELTMLTSSHEEERSPFLADIPSEALERGKAQERKKPAGKQLGFF